MKFFIKDFFSKCDQIRRKLRMWSHLLKKSFIEYFIFCAVLRKGQKIKEIYSTMESTRNKMNFLFHVLKFNSCSSIAKVRNNYAEEKN